MTISGGVLQIGIIGLPTSGKSTLFQTLTKTYLDASALARSESHQSVIKVPDARLSKLIEMFNPKKTNFASIEFVDIIGLQKGDSGSAQFTSNFLGKIKTNDALIHVVRLFENELVPHPEGKIDLMRDINIIETEFIIADLTVAEKRIENLKKQILKIHDDLLKKELAVLEKCYDILQNEKPLREGDLNKDELKFLKSYQFLSLKPQLIAVNLDETQSGDTEKIFETLVKNKLGHNTKAVTFFGKIEMELSEMPDEEASVFMEEYGIKESALNSIIREAYSLLGLQSFFTVGEDECRAWTIRKGMTAQEAAGEIHTDFYNKFIRAEVVHYEDYIAAGSFAKTKDLGTWRLEGKEYVVKDGDIISIRHN